jgi:nucleoid DNA-binding protein
MQAFRQSKTKSCLATPVVLLKILAPELEKFYLHGHELAAPENPMTKNEIATLIAGRAGIIQPDARRIVQLVFDGISDTIASEGRLELRGFGVFEIRTRKSRKARNPKTGESVMVPERKVVSFKPGKEMVEKALGR